MKYVCCNLCGEDDTELVNRGPDLLLNRRETDYQLVRCRQCGLIYQNPLLGLDDLLEHYPDNYISYRPAIESEASRLVRLDRRNGLNRYCRTITVRRPEPGHLLDIGCSTGLFLDAMRARGWRVSGLDLNPYAVDYARRTFNLAVKSGPLEEAAYEDDAFDVITLWGVFEHVIDPKMTLEECVRILKPGGLLAMTTPNPTGLEARLFGSNWAGWDRPRHLHLYTPKVMERYLLEAGFHVDTVVGLSARLSYSLLNFEYWCRAKDIPEESWRPLLRATFNWPMRVLTWPFYKVGDALRLTLDMGVFATLRE